MKYLTICAICDKEVSAYLEDEPIVCHSCSKEFGTDDPAQALKNKLKQIENRIDSIDKEIILVRSRTGSDKAVH